MNKKLFGAFIAGTSAIALASCGGPNYDILVFHNKVESQSEFEELSKRYEEKTGYVVEFEGCGGGCEYGSQLMSKMKKSDAPTIFSIASPEDLDTWDGYLYDISDTPLYKANEDFHSYYDIATDETGVYGYPVTTEGYGLIYNATILGEQLEDEGSYGTVTYDPSKTKEENGHALADWMGKSYANSKQVIEDITANKSALGVNAAFATPGSETWVTGLHMTNVATSRVYSGVPDAAGQDTLSTEAINRLYDLESTYNLYINNDINSNDKASINTTNYDTQISTFAQGETAFIQQGNWVYSEITGEGKLSDDQIGFMPIPYNNTSLSGAQKEADHDKIYVGVPNFWSINAKASQEEIDIAIDFIEFMYTEELEYVVEEIGFIAPYDGADEYTLSNPLAVEINEAISANKTHPWTFSGYPNSGGWGMDEFAGGNPGLQTYTVSSDANTVYNNSNTSTWTSMVDANAIVWEDMRS